MGEIKSSYTIEIGYQTYLFFESESVGSEPLHVNLYASDRPIDTPSKLNLRYFYVNDVRGGCNRSLPVQ